MSFKLCGFWRAMCSHAPVNSMYFRPCVNVKFTFLNGHGTQENIQKGYRGMHHALLQGNGYFINQYHTSVVRYGNSESSNVTYEELLKLNEKGETFLIDVREPEEIAETGKLPGSTHIPLGELKTALENLSAKEFCCKYGAPKPERNAAIVFSCKSGVRSVKAMEQAIKSGFINSRSYGGGFMEWLEKEKNSSERK